MNKQIKIVAIADCHGKSFVDLIPDCDICLICGDITPVDRPHTYGDQKYWFENEYVQELEELSKKAKSICFIAGNHDKYFYDQYISGNNNSIKNKLPPNVYYLCDESVEIEGIKIYGSPWCNLPKWACEGGAVWNFAKDDSKLESIFSNIPEDIDILMTHGPAFGFCDQLLDERLLLFREERFGDKASAEKLGSKALMGRIILNSAKENFKLKYVLSGHLHSSNHNFELYKWAINSDGVKFACVSILNEEYKLGDYKPLEINYEV